MHPGRCPRSVRRSTPARGSARTVRSPRPAPRCRCAARRRCAPPHRTRRCRRSRTHCGSGSAAVRPCRRSAPRPDVRPVDVDAASSSGSSSQIPQHPNSTFATRYLMAGPQFSCRKRGMTGSDPDGQRTTVSSVAAMRLALTAGCPGRLAASGWANVATRSSSSCQVTSRRAWVACPAPRESTTRA